MSKTEEKKGADTKKENKEKKEENATPEQEGKKSKLFLFLGIGLIALISLGVGGFFVAKTFFGKKELHAKSTEEDHSKTESKKDDTKKDEKNDSKEVKKDDPQKETADKDKNSKDAPKDAPKDEKVDSHQNKESKDGNDSKAKDSKEKDAKESKESNDKDAKESKDKDAKESNDKDAKDSKEATTSKKSSEETASTFGDIYVVPRLELNLGNPIENRYLRLSISLEYQGGKAQEEVIKRRDPQIRDIIISSVSNKTRIELLQEKGKEKLRKELLNRINEVMDQPVANLYFTEFLVE